MPDSLDRSADAAPTSTQPACTQSACTQSACTVPTAHASRYLQQLCKHWMHKFDVAFDPNHGRIIMPENRTVTLDATPDALLVTLDAPADTAAHMRQIVESHIARFAFREDLVFAWRP